jgi:CheY-like chemotaxis protein
MADLLIVDDDPDGSEAIATYLSRAGHRVACVPNGQEAMKALLEGRPQAVVLDIRMPELDGMSLLEILRSYLRWSHLPVILLSAYVTEEQIERARELGVSHVFHKANFALKDLGAAVEQVAK